MSDKVGADALAPLWSVAEGDAEPAICIAALDAASRFPLSEDGWRQCAGLTHKIIVSEPAGSPARLAALKLAVRIPLLSVRRHLRNMTANRDDPDWEAVAAALDHVGDPSRIRPLLDQARNDRGESFEKLAAMAVEDEGIGPGDIPPLPEGAVPDAPLWRALLAARLGDFDALDAIFEGAGAEPELFWGDPWTAYNTIASIRPVPQPMRQHLLDAVERLANSARGRMVRLIAWAATGVADAQGSPMVQPEATGSAALAPAPAPSREMVKQAEAATKRLPQRLFDRTVSPGEIEILVNLPSKRFAALVTRTVIEANKRARALPPEAPVNMVLGNEVIQLIPSRAPTADWPVARLAIEQVTTERSALDDGQMAWVIARGRPDHLIQEMAGILNPQRPSAERLRILSLLGTAADYQAGRGGSPWRGAGPGGAGESAGRSALIDDRPRAATRAARSSPGPTAEEKRERDGQEVEERRVHAQIRHQGKRRHTFLAGADNVIRCWIGLPEPEQAAVAASAVPQVAIPAEGLPLTAELCWGEQTDRKHLVLPAERSARTGDCDLHIRVPEGERYVSAEIAFRFRGRVFEVVQVEAFALAAGEQETPDHKVRVRVQVSRREVIDLPDSSEFDATVIWGADRSRPAQDSLPPAPSLRVFGGQGGKRYDLKDSDAAIKWLNEALFVTEKSLVRRRAAQTGAEEVLDAGDAEVLALLRDMARHGANLYNQLREQGFKDPGERIQLLNREPDTYVPLEFVYDRGYPADDARLCEGGLAALTTDSRTCPTCGKVQIPDGERNWVPVICPMGFWSLQKIIERLDSDGTKDEDGTAPSSAPRPGQRSLPVIDTMVFASSHRVPEEERQTTWQTLQQSFQAPVLANNWDEWKEAVKRHPPLLLVLPHHDVKAALDYLQIGDERLPDQLGQLSRGQLTELYVNPDGRQPGPIVLLLGCRTGARIENGYVQLARRFQRLHTSIVLGTLAEILGRHAAPLARELISQLVAVNDAQADFGTIMRRVRRRMLGRGYLMALCLVTLGDAEWRLTPRPPSGNPS